MKSAYELAMERLNRAAPSVKITNDQKKRLAELDSQYAAKIAEREIFLRREIQKAVDQGDAEAVAQLEKQLASERKKFQTQLEEKKDVIRQEKR
jgi:hypothetical protein